VFALFSYLSVFIPSALAKNKQTKPHANKLKSPVSEFVLGMKNEFNLKSIFSTVKDLAADSEFI